MPDITPVTPIAAAAPSAAVLPGAPGTPLPGQDFLGQLTAALKSLKGLVSVAPQPAVPAAPATIVADGPKDDKSAPQTDAPAQPSDDVLELLASLGLVTPPLPQPVAPQTGGATTTPSKTVSAAPSAPTAPQAPAHQAAAPAAAAPAEPPAPAPQAATDAMQASQTPVAPTPATHEASTPSTPAAAAPQTPTQSAPAPQTPAAQALASQAPAPALTPVQPATPQHPVLAPVARHADVSSGGGGTFQQNTDTSSGGGNQSPNHTARVATDSAPTPPTDVAPVAERVMAAAAPAVQPAPVTPNVHPGEVVGQIANQVDLYRLPGNKGVRIQLHPEDLGGVQVTVRYAAGGNLELHINVEHAATGALVQAGMAQLRDALATQGFRPDRLVMSVTAPSSASQMDFSSNSNGGSYRSDSGLAAFTQGGQSDEQRQRDDAPSSPGRSGSIEPVVTESTPTTSSASSDGTSRIDYRA